MIKSIKTHGCRGKLQIQYHLQNFSPFAKVGTPIIWLVEKPVTWLIQWKHMVLEANYESKTICKISPPFAKVGSIHCSKVEKPVTW